MTLELGIVSGLFVKYLLRTAYSFSFLEDIVGDLKKAYGSGNPQTIENKSKLLEERYQSPLIVEYSEELDDPELLKLVIDRFLFASVEILHIIISSFVHQCHGT